MNLFKKYFSTLSLSLLLISLLAKDGFAQKPAQANIGYRTVKVLKINGLEFKDLNKNSKLDIQKVRFY